MPGESARINGRKGGRPKGSKAPHTLEKLAAREAVRVQITAALAPIVEAQIANAIGIKYLVVRQKSTGRFLRRVGATDSKTHDPDTEIIEIHEKDPSVQAAVELFNRALDKVTEQVSLTGADDGPVVFQWQQS
jgi:hypothetical protein